MDLRMEELAPDVVRARLPRWDATVGAVAGSEGVLVVDTGASPAEGAALRAAVRKHFGQPVTHVALTHGHFDHVLGTSALPGARVYGAVGLADLLAHGGEALRRDAVEHGMDQAEAARATEHIVPPGHSVSGELTLTLGGGRRVLLANVGPGHTGHDLAVFVPGAGGVAPEVVFCGDLVEESGPPQAGADAHPAWWPAALDRLLALGGEDAAYVPGHGAVVGAPFVRAQRGELVARHRESS